MPTTTPDSKPLDLEFHENEDDARIAHKGVNLGLDHIRASKKRYLRMARRFNHMLDTDPARLLELIKMCLGPNADHQDYIRSRFGGLLLIGDDPFDLIAAVREGLTERQYLSTTPAIFLAKNKQKKRDPDPVERPIPADPDPGTPLTDAQRADLWHSRALAFEAENRDIKARLRIAERTIAIMEKEVAKLNRLFNAPPTPVH